MIQTWFEPRVANGFSAAVQPRVVRFRIRQVHSLPFVPCVLTCIESACGPIGGEQQTQRLSAFLAVRLDDCIWKAAERGLLFQSNHEAANGLGLAL